MTDHYLRQQADLNPEAPFLVTRDVSFTYGEVDGLVSGRARDLGDRAGEQVVVRAGIDVESVVEILAATRSGATAVVISAESAGRSLGIQGRRCRPGSTPLPLDPVYERELGDTQRGSVDRIELGGGCSCLHQSSRARGGQSLAVSPPSPSCRWPQHPLPEHGRRRQRRPRPRSS